MFPAVATFAQEPEFDPKVEAAAREVGKSLRCVVCQNQSIEDSAAPLAADMRRLVRERLAAGESPDQVRAYMTDRYGNFVLMKPPFQFDTLLLWLGPLLFAGLALTGWLVYVRPRAQVVAATEPLTDEEQRALAERLSQGTQP
jgi:cytochrome c-type biogenesis protein CcmH